MSEERKLKTEELSRAMRDRLNAMIDAGRVAPDEALAKLREFVDAAVDLATWAGSCEFALAELVRCVRLREKMDAGKATEAEANDYRASKPVAWAMAIRTIEGAALDFERARRAAERAIRAARK